MDFDDPSTTHCSKISMSQGRVCMHAWMYVCYVMFCYVLLGYVSVCAYVRMYVRTYVRVYVCMFVCNVCMYVCMYVIINVCMYVMLCFVNVLLCYVC